LSTIRASYNALVERLGEPGTMEPHHPPGSTLLVYTLQWSCGCKAEGARDHYTCRLCKTHAVTPHR